jgi:hypothetical protein
MFHHNLEIWVSKDAELYVNFKNINVPLWQNAPKKVNPEKRAILGFFQKWQFLGLTF